MLYRIISALTAISVLAFMACTSPRSQFESGRVTPLGSIDAGGQMVINIGTAPAKKIADAALIPIDELGNLFQRTDTLTAEEAASLRENVGKLGEGAVAYACDPTGAGMVWFARYGLAPRMDVGYKYIAGSHSLDARFQFLGPTAYGKKMKTKKMNTASSLWYGSAGIQVTTQGMGSPNWLGALTDDIAFDFRRTDWILPITMSYSFGQEEEYGAIAWGICYSQSNLRYTTESAVVVQALNDQGLAERIEIRDISGKTVARGMGGFIHLKLGYHRIFVTPSLSLYYHHFGSFPNVLGPDFALKGWSIIPSVGVRFMMR